jgi:hypothetical protein
MADEIRLEKIADDFVEIYLKEHPVMIYSLDTEIKEYVENEGLSKNRDDILREYLERKTSDRKIIDERINILDKTVYVRDNKSKLGNSILLLEYTQSIADPLIQELTRLVITSNKVRIRSFEELEDVELEDSIMPNEWIYHKDMNSTEVSDCVLQYYDNLKQEDDIDG